MSRWRVMTVDECIRVVESFEFRGGLSTWEPKLTACALGSGATCVQVHFSLVVPNRDNPGGEPTVIVSADESWSLDTINLGLIPFEELVADFVRGMIEHETHEGLWVGGRQLRNPHDQPEAY